MQSLHSRCCLAWRVSTRWPKRRPARRKMTVFPMNSMNSHTVCMVSLDTNRGHAKYENMQPALTTASTPLVSISFSAKKKQRKPQQTVTATWIIASLWYRVSAEPKMTMSASAPMAMPRNTDTTVICRKKMITPWGDRDSPLQTVFVILKRTIAVPSFSRLSPEMSIVKRGETPNVLKSATTATGSVAARMEPKTKAVAHDQL
mmetsp:Transcript_102232/g.284785  ORF Transcript_102232/g.284785 Transcript_102232/m.284785 type:complete len:203 (-) Transcript_102232:193-801(-)